MSVEEKKTQEIIVQSTRCVLFTPIFMSMKTIGGGRSVYSTCTTLNSWPHVVKDFGPDRIFQSVVGVRIVIGGKCMCELSGGGKCEENEFITSLKQNKKRRESRTKNVTLKLLQWWEGKTEKPMNLWTPSKDFYLLWIDKVRAKDKTYIWVSVWWKTTN